MKIVLTKKEIKTLRKLIKELPDGVFDIEETMALLKRAKEAAKESGEAKQPAPAPKKITTVRRYDLCSVKRLQSRDDIDAYVEGIRQKLYQTLESCDGVQVN